MIGSRRDVTGIFWIPTAFREQKEGELATVEVKKENGQRGWRRNKQRISRKAVWSALSDFIAKSIKTKVWTFNLTARRSLLRGVSGPKNSFPCRKLGNEWNLMEAVRPVNLHLTINISRHTTKVPFE